MITLQVLRDLRACAEAQTAFEKAFPNGAPTWRAVAAHSDCQKEWKGWIAVRAPGLSFEDRLSLADQSDWPGLHLMVAVHAPGLSLGEREALADQNDDPAYWRGWIAFRAPGLSFEERLSLADKSDKPDYWRSWIKYRYIRESKP